MKVENIWKVVVSVAQKTCLLHFEIFLLFIQIHFDLTLHPNFPQTSSVPLHLSIMR